MKKHYYFFISLCVGFFSCNEQEIFVDDVAEIIPLVKTRTSVSSFDKCSEGYLHSGKKVALPWNELAKTTIPDDIRNDVKSEDGWIILDSTVDLIGYPVTVASVDEGINYVILYNTFSGVLKGFYYAETMLANNCGFWQLTTSANTKLFNFVPYFAEAISGNSPQQAILSTVTKNGITGGFELGWNCFMQELSYDSNSRNQKLNISAFALNRASITLKGAYQSKSNGTVVSSTGQQSNLIDGVASGMGAAGKQWVLDNTKGDENDNSKPIKYIGVAIGTLLDKGISGFIATGLNSIFGSLLGTTRTSMDLNFTTNGQATISGELVSSTSGSIHPVAGLKLGNGSMNLGVWNLEAKPSYEAPSYAELKKIESKGYGIAFFYKLKFIPHYALTKNPAVNGTFSYSVKRVTYGKYNNRVSPLYQINANDTKSVYREGVLTTLYEDSLTTIYDRSDEYTVMVVDLYPNKTSTANVPSVDFNGSGYNIRENVVFKTLTTLVVNNNGRKDTVYSSKSFVPNHVFNTQQTARPYRWTLQELKNCGYKW